MQEMVFTGGGAKYTLKWYISNYGTYNANGQTGKLIQVILDSLYANEEMDWDQGSSSDEPYLVVTGFQLNPEVRAWAVTPEPWVCNDVDSGEWACEKVMPMLLFSPPAFVSPQTLFGFKVVLMERDYSLPEQRKALAAGILDKVVKEISSVSLSHVGDCEVGTGTYVSSWALGVGEDLSGGSLVRTPVHNVGEPPDHLWWPGDDPNLSMNRFGFDEPFGGVEYKGKMRFCGGLGCDHELSPVSILSSILDLPQDLRQKLDRELSGGFQPIPVPR